MSVRSRDDAEGRVRISVMLVGPRHQGVKGNMMKVITVRGMKVSEVAAKIHRALFRVLRHINEGGVMSL